MQIVSNKNELIRSGNEIVDLSREYEQKIKEIKEIIERMRQYWKGQDADTFQNMINEKCIPALEQIRQKIENFGNYIKQVPIIYETFEKNTVDSVKKG